MIVDKTDKKDNNNSKSVVPVMAIGNVAIDSSLPKSAALTQGIKKGEREERELK
jgi:hypothetical protein